MGPTVNEPAVWDTLAVHFRVVIQKEAGSRESATLDSSAELSDQLAQQILAIAPDTRLLRYLDPYGDLVLNHLQMAHLLDDLDHLEGRTALDDADRAALAEIRSLASQCASGVHTYIAFIGD